MCLLGVSLTLLPILRVKSPENPNFWGVNRCFQAKQAKYWKFHVIETPASISTKFYTTMETIKWSSRVVPIGTQQIQDGGRPPFWKKPLNRHLSNRLTDFDEIWYNDAYSILTADLPLKFRIFENPRWRQPPCYKITKIATYPQRNLVYWCKMAPLTAPTVKKFEFQKSKMADSRHFDNC